MLHHIHEHLLKKSISRSPSKKKCFANASQEKCFAIDIKKKVLLNIHHLFSHFKTFYLLITHNRIFVAIIEITQIIKKISVVNISHKGLHPTVRLFDYFIFLAFKCVDTLFVFFFFSCTCFFTSPPLLLPKFLLFF